MTLNSLTDWPRILRCPSRIPLVCMMLIGSASAGICTGVPGAGSSSPAKHRDAAPGSWRISGNLSEACSCNVPCTCNFGQGASPGNWCWTMFSLDIRKGTYQSTVLDGLHLAAASGPKGFVYYVDDRASPAQSVGLRMIARTIAASSYRGHNFHPAPEAPLDPGTLAIQAAHIDQHSGALSSGVSIGGVGGFEANYLIGLDGRTPIRLENNWSFNIRNNIKAKTRRFHYQDRFGNKYDLSNTNSNQGTFDWNDETAVYFR